MSMSEVLQNRCIRKQILLTEADAEKLKLVSEYTKASQNEIVNQALADYFRTRFQKEDVQ